MIKLKKAPEFQHFTLLQIRYLMELEKIGPRRGMVAEIAKNCGGSHGPVSTFLKECCKNGYLTEDYTFTEFGKAALNSYKQIVEETENYLKRIHVTEEKREETMRSLIGSLDYDELLRIVHSDRNLQEVQKEKKNKGKTSHFLKNMLEYGNYDVLIDVRKIREEGEIRAKLSMADRGFCHVGRIRHNKRGSWLELGIVDMYAGSQNDGKIMKGRLATLKYIKDGDMVPVEISGDKLTIRLDAFKFRKVPGEPVQGYLPITVTCSVGTMHMPESAAILSFYL